MTESENRAATALAAIDELAEGVLAVSSVDFAVAGDEGEREREEAFRLRNLVAVRAGWIAPDAYPDGLERDEDDEDAVHIIGRSDGKVVAASRLVFPAPDRPLPVERLFGFEVEPRGKVVEVGRLSVDPVHRRRDHTTFLGLLCKSWLEMRSRGYHTLAGNASAEMLDRYAEMGLHMKVLAGPTFHWGEDRYAIRFDVVENVEGVRATYGAYIQGEAELPGRQTARRE